MGRIRQLVLKKQGGRNPALLFMLGVDKIVATYYNKIVATKEV